MNCCSFISVAIASVMWFISFFFSFCFVFLLNGCEFLSNKTRGVSVFLVAAGRWRHFTSREKELKIKFKKRPQIAPEARSRVKSAVTNVLDESITFLFLLFISLFSRLVLHFRVVQIVSARTRTTAPIKKKKKMNNLFEDQQQHLGITSFLHIPHAVNAWCDVGNPSFTLQTNMTLIAGAPESGYCTFQLTV